MQPKRKARRDGISATKVPAPFMTVEQLRDKKPHLYRLLRFMLAQKKRICTKEVVNGMMQRQMHYPRWKRYLYMLRDMGYVEKHSHYSANRKKVLLVEWWVLPEWAEKLKHLRQSPIWDRLKPSIKLNGTTGCWEWQGYIREADGHGVVGWDNKVWYAHYVVFKLFKPLPKDMGLVHTCATSSCTNPKHMKIVEGDPHGQRD